MRDQLRIISVNSHNLTTLTVDLQKGLNDTKDNLTRIQNNCSTISNPSPKFCNDTNTDDLNTEADFTNLPDVSSELSNIEEVINQDFEKSANEVSYQSKIILFLITICIHVHMPSICFFTITRPQNGQMLGITLRYQCTPNLIIFPKKVFLVFR